MKHIAAEHIEETLEQHTELGELPTGSPSAAPASCIHDECNPRKLNSKAVPCARPPTGRPMYLASTSSSGIAPSEASYNKLFSNICTGIMGASLLDRQDVFSVNRAKLRSQAAGKTLLT